MSFVQQLSQGGGAALGIMERYPGLRGAQSGFEPRQIEVHARTFGLRFGHGAAGAQAVRHLLHDADALHGHLVAVEPIAVYSADRHILDAKHEFGIGQLSGWTHGEFCGAR
ncbi:MAG: hypothetical protein M0D54_02105 [Hyphomonadaceae bacterium JAD_PAG50586_4]|nr:MAG: hypothetical protein M0D54_02105 [Hyphomonadaceae bacterium JAD_PAG50586_4]